MPQTTRKRSSLPISFRIGAPWKSCSELAWLSAATQPLRDFAAELRREFLMAGFEAIGCSCEFFPCRVPWHSLVCRLSSSCCCSVESHGEAAMTRRQPTRAAALRVAATSPLWPSLDLTTLACCHAASSADALRGKGLLMACCSSTVVSKPRVLVRSRRGWRVSMISPVLRAV